MHARRDAQVLRAACPLALQAGSPCLQALHPRNMSTPPPRRSAPHCIEYAHLILWASVRPGEDFDTDNEEHMKWVYERALERSQQYGIQVRARGAHLGECSNPYYIKVLILRPRRFLHLEYPF